jgi:hypothetical protein
MRSRAHHLLSMVVFSILAIALLPSATHAQQLWFNMTNYNMPNGVDGPQGWNKLFVEPNAPWPEFMNHVQVVAAAGIWQTLDTVLAKAFSKLNQHHIPFAMETLAQSWVHQPECGHGVEGYYDPPGARKTAEKIKAAGGELAYVAMDEPLWYGHYYSGPNACRSDINNVAERAAAIIAEYKKVFPNVVVIDIEPFPAITDQPGWQNDYRRWMQAFNQATGMPIKALHVDINWGHANWQQSLRETVRFAQDATLPIGIIYNGDTHNDHGTSEGWLASAVDNFTVIERRMGIHPAQAIFHSWDKFPTHSITDNTGPGEDWLVKQYLQQHP